MGNPTILIKLGSKSIRWQQAGYYAAQPSREAVSYAYVGATAKDAKAAPSAVYVGDPIGFMAGQLPGFTNN